MLGHLRRFTPSSRPLALLLALCALALGALVLTPSPANAASANASGTVGVGNPTYRPVNPGTCVPGSETRPYAVVQARLNGTAASTLNVTVTPNGFRAQVTIYQGVFLPENSQVNCFDHPVLSPSAGADASYTTPLTDLSGFPGVTGQTFYIVVSGVSATDLGSFTATIESTNATSVEIGTPAPDPDTTAPVLTLPGNLTEEATGPNGALVPITVSANDDRDGSRPVTCTPTTSSRFPIGTTTVSCSASDTAGNTSHGSFTVTVRDTTGPVIVFDGADTLEATGPGGAAVTYSATATDAVDGNRPVSCSPPSGTVLAIGMNNLICSSEDSRGNRSEKTLNITVQDTSAPVLVVPGNMTVEATGPSGAVVEFTDPTATDVVSGTRPVTCSTTSGSTFALGTTTVTCTATDAADNTATRRFDVTVEDTTAPVVTAPIDLDIEAPTDTGALVTFDATVTDAVTSGLTAACSPASGTRFALGSTSVTCTATDGAGNLGSTTFDVTVSDGQGPALSLPADKTVEATGDNGAIVDYAVSATDAVDGDLPVTCFPLSGSSFPLGTTTVSCGATDAANNETRQSFSVTVEDTTAPDVVLPANVVTEATGPDGAPVDFVASGVDLVDGVVLASCTPAAGSVFDLGVTQVSCTATDAAQNTSAPATFTFLVQDTTGPVITAPVDLAVDRAGPDGATVTYDATAVDLVDGTITPSCLPASGTTFAKGDTTVSCTATDAADNSAMTTFTVHVADPIAPVLTLPGPLSVEATGPDGATATYDTAALDSTGAPVPVTCSTASGATFPLGTTTVDCTAIDDKDNRTEGSFTVLVQDTTGPVIDLPEQTVVAEATGPEGARVTFRATATDAVTGDVPVTCTPASGSVFQVGRTTVRCTATDTVSPRIRARATSSATFDVVVRAYQAAPTGGSNTAAASADGGSVLPAAGSMVNAAWIGLAGLLVALGGLLVGAARRRPNS